MSYLYYNYAIKNSLKTLTEELEPAKYSNILLCTYNINCKGLYPFLEILLVEDWFGLTFPKLLKYNKLTHLNIYSYSLLYLSNVFETDYNKINSLAEMDGFLEYDNNLYLFINVTKCSFKNQYNNAIFGIIDEILNSRFIYNLCIDTYVNNFFFKNPNAIWLLNEKGQEYEIPVSGYVGKSSISEIKQTFEFGENSKDKSAILGPYYYFTDYFNCTSSRALVRFALFIGNCKIIENMPNDPEDESLTKKHRLQDKKLDNAYEIATLRISDHDGLWVEQYDSAYLGKIQLDNKTFLENGPQTIVKERNQQIPLSYKWINK